MVLGDVKSGECHGDGTYSDIYQWFERASKGTCGFVRCPTDNFLEIVTQTCKEWHISPQARFDPRNLRQWRGPGVCQAHPAGQRGGLMAPPLYYYKAITHTWSLLRGVVSGYSSTGTHSHQAHVSFETSVRTRVVIFSQILELDSC